jgi:hypothetical protein
MIRIAVRLTLLPFLLIALPIAFLAAWIREVREDFAAQQPPATRMAPKKLAQSIHCQDRGCLTAPVECTEVPACRELWDTRNPIPGDQVGQHF